MNSNKEIEPNDLRLAAAALMLSKHGDAAGVVSIARETVEAGEAEGLILALASLSNSILATALDDQRLEVTYETLREHLVAWAASA